MRSIEGERVEYQRQEVDGDHLVEIVHGRLGVVEGAERAVVVIVSGLVRRLHASMFAVRLSFPLETEQGVLEAGARVRHTRACRRRRRRKARALHMVLLLLLLLEHRLWQCLVEYDHHEHHGDRVGDRHHQHALVETLHLLEGVGIKVKIIGRRRQGRTTLLKVAGTCCCCRRCLIVCRR